MYQANNIALYIIRERIRANEPVSNYRLAQILLLCQVRHLQSTKAPLFEGDFTKTENGIRIVDVYDTYAIWGGSRITRMDAKPDEFIDFEDMLFINEVINSLNGLEVWEVSALRELSEIRTLTTELPIKAVINLKEIVKHMSKIPTTRPKIEYPAFGINIPCLLTTNRYTIDGSLAIEAIVAGDITTLDGQEFMGGEAFVTITINPSSVEFSPNGINKFVLQHNCVLLDTKDCPNITDILTSANLGKPTGRYAQSSSSSHQYPEWEFETEDLVRMS